MQKEDITLINTYACNILIGAPKYWVGSITSYGRTQMSFLANSIHKTNTNRHKGRNWQKSRRLQHSSHIKGQIFQTDPKWYSSCSVMSDSLRTHGLQHARPPCPSSTPRVYSNSCPLSQWCHPTISSSVIPFSCLQSFAASGPFQMSQFSPSGGQSTGVSASAWVLPMNIQYWFPLGRTGWISLQFKGLSRVFSNTTVQKHQFFGTQLSL